MNDFIERLGPGCHFDMISVTKMLMSLKEKNVYKSVRAHYDRT